MNANEAWLKYSEEQGMHPHSAERDTFEAGYEAAATAALADRAELNEAFGFAWMALSKIATAETTGWPVSAVEAMDQLRSLYPKATEGKS